MNKSKIFNKCVLCDTPNPDLNRKASGLLVKKTSDLGVKPGEDVSVVDIYIRESKSGNLYYTCLFTKKDNTENNYQAFFRVSISSDMLSIPFSGLLRIPEIKTKVVSAENEACCIIMTDGKL